MFKHILNAIIVAQGMVKKHRRNFFVIRLDNGFYKVVPYSVEDRVECEVDNNGELTWYLKEDATWVTS